MSRTVVVTGGGTGFGRAIAAKFAADGDVVHITGRRGEVLERTAVDLGPLVRPLVCDGSDPASVERAAEAIDATVDVLVNNAGGHGSGRAGLTGLMGVAERWRADLDANLMTAVLMTEGLTERLGRGAALVHVGSLAAERGGSYGAAKAAMASWNQGVAARLGPLDVTSNVVAPGYVPGTEFFPQGRAQGSLHEQLVADTALRRAGEVVDVVGAVYFLASPAARFITGQVINVNGGAFTVR